MGNGLGVWGRSALGVALLGAWMAGCGDSPLATGSGGDAAGDVGKLDAKNPDGAADDIADATDSDATDGDLAPGDDLADTGQDVVLSDGVFILDTGPLADTGGATDDATCGGSDAKITDFHVVSTNPPDGTAGVGIPFTFTVTFNTLVKEVVIGPNTVQVVVNGAIIDGTFSVACNSFSFTSAGPVLQASRVDVTLSPLVQAEIGYNLPNQQSFHFYVRGFDGMAPYE